MGKKSILTKSLIVVTFVASVAMASDKDLEINDENKEIQIKSSIQLKDDASEIEQMKSVKIKLENILSTLRSNFEGKIIQIELDNEENNLVYKAEILQQNDIVKEIILDPGNGQILLSRNDKNEDEDEDEESWYKFWR